MKISQIAKIIEKYGAEKIIQALEPYVTENRKKRIENLIRTRLSSIQLAMESPTDINNAFAAVRSSEAFGISTTHIIGNDNILDIESCNVKLQKPNQTMLETKSEDYNEVNEHHRKTCNTAQQQKPNQTMLETRILDDAQGAGFSRSGVYNEVNEHRRKTCNTARGQKPKFQARGITKGACYWINLLYHDSFEKFAAKLKNQNYLLAGATMEGNYQLSELPIDKPICLIMGNEHNGLSETAKKTCDILYRIPMYGMSESLNLSVSAAISLYDITQRKRQLLNTKSTNTDLTLAEQLATRAHCYLNSVDQRLALALLT